MIKSQSRTIIIHIYKRATIISSREWALSEVHRDIKRHFSLVWRRGEGDEVFMLFMCYLWHFTVSEGCLNIIPQTKRKANERRSDIGVRGASKLLTQTRSRYRTIENSNNEDVMLEHDTKQFSCSSKIEAKRRELNYRALFTEVSRWKKKRTTKTERKGGKPKPQ